MDMTLISMMTTPAGTEGKPVHAPSFPLSGGGSSGSLFASLLAICRSGTCPSAEGSEAALPTQESRESDRGEEPETPQGLTLPVVGGMGGATMITPYVDLPVLSPGTTHPQEQLDSLPIAPPGVCGETGSFPPDVSRTSGMGGDTSVPDVQTDAVSVDLTALVTRSRSDDMHFLWRRDAPPDDLSSPLAHSGESRAVLRPIDQAHSMTAESKEFSSVEKSGVPGGRPIQCAPLPVIEPARGAQESDFTHPASASSQKVAMVTLLSQTETEWGGDDLTQGGATEEPGVQGRVRDSAGSWGRHVARTGTPFPRLSSGHGKNPAAPWEIPAVRLTAVAGERLSFRDPLPVIEPVSGAEESDLTPPASVSSQKVANSAEIIPEGGVPNHDNTRSQGVKTAGDLAAVRRQGDLDPRSIADQLERHLTLPSRHAEQRTVRLELHPEELGKVQVTLSLENQSLRVEILTERPAVRAALLEQVDQLRDNLLRRNVSIDSFEISTRPDGFSQEMPQQRREPAKGGQAFPRWSDRVVLAGHSGVPAGAVQPGEREYSLVDMRM